MTWQNGNKATRCCRCGFLADPARACSRAPRCAQDYQAKISGPVFNRIDLHVDVPAVAAAEGSAAVAARVAQARARQRERFARMPEAGRPRSNAEADGKLLEEIATPEPDGQRLLSEATEGMKLSARGYHRVLRVARTLADLERSESVRRLHIAEALSYRRVVPGRT